MWLFRYTEACIKCFLILLVFSFAFMISGEARAQCRLEFTHSLKGDGKEITLRHSKCTESELKEVAKFLSGGPREIYLELIRRSFSNPVDTEPRRCEFGACAPCRVDPRGSCGLVQVLPKVFRQMTLKPILQAPSENRSRRLQSQVLYLAESTPELQEHLGLITVSDPQANEFDKSTIAAFSQAGGVVLSLSQIENVVVEGGRRIGYSWNILAKGEGEGQDQIASEALQGLRREASMQFRTALRSVEQALHDTQDSSARVDVSFASEAALGTQLLIDTRRSVERSFSQVLKSENILNVPNSVVIGLKNLAKAELQVSDLELETLRQGMLTKEAEEKAKSELCSQLVSLSPGEFAEVLSGYQGLIGSTTNPLRREQYENVLRKVTDNRGILADSAAVMGIPTALQLKSGEETVIGRAVRQVLNEAIGYLGLSADAQAISSALGLVAKADRLYSENDRRGGNRMLNRARSILDFEAGSSRVDSYRAVQLSLDSMSRFGMDFRVSDYQSYQLARVSNELASITESGFSDNQYLISQIAIRNMISGLAGDKNQESFNRWLDNAFSVLDFAQGVAGGAIEGSQDLIASRSQIVIHPVDSAGAAINVIKNWDKVYEEAYKEVSKTFTEFPELTAEEKGRLIGKIAVGIATVLCRERVVKLKTTLTEAAALEVVSGASRELVDPLIEATKGIAVLRKFAAEKVATFPLMTQLRLGKMTYQLVYGDKMEEENAVRMVMAQTM